MKRFPPNYWTKEKCAEFALKFNSRNEWRNARYFGYEAAQKNGWLEDCCFHMGKPKRQPRMSGITREICINDAMRFNSLNEWKLKSKTAYNFAKKWNFIDEIDFVCV